MAKSSGAGGRDPRVDAYIEKAPSFARPILEHFREAVHEACPQIEESIKWGHPSFAHHGIVCGISAFKEHCAFGFWKAALLDGVEIRQQAKSVDDLPKRRDLVRIVKQAAKLNEDGIKVPDKERREGAPGTQARQRAAAPRDLKVPDVLTRALRQNKPAAAAFEDLSYSHKKEYVEWIEEAKTEETRQRRVETTMAWVAEGKPRNWKYMKK